MMNRRKCFQCKQVKSILEFYRDKNMPLGRRYQCKVCSKKSYKKWAMKDYERYLNMARTARRKYIKKLRKNPGKYKNLLRKQRVAGKRWREHIKEEVFKHYSPKLICIKCGYGDLRALCMDHINGGGLAHIKKIGGGGENLYNWLKKNNYPKGYQVLCPNCNIIKKIENHEGR